MIRGMYTSASSMLAKTHDMDVVANNLANANTIGYKNDKACFKAFPEMLIRRINDDGVCNFPLGSIDSRPVVGKIGTGVEVNEVFTQQEQGGLKKTDNALDLAIDGKGFFTLQTEKGERYTRNGSFLMNKDGFLVNKQGFKVLGTNGPINIKANNITISENGDVFINNDFKNNKDRLVQASENSWENTAKINTLKIVDFENIRFIEKEGNSLYKSTELSGEAFNIENNRPKVQQGFLENSNVNIVKEMVGMIKVQRAYEASQKSIQAHNELLYKLINDMAKS